MSILLASTDFLEGITIVTEYSESL